MPTFESKGSSWLDLLSYDLDAEEDGSLKWIGSVISYEDNTERFISTLEQELFHLRLY